MELRQNIGKIVANFQVENYNLETFTKLSVENKNEILNEEGINQSGAKLFLTVGNLEGYSLGEKAVLRVKVSFNGEEKLTRSILGENGLYTWNDPMEFDVRRKDQVMFVLLNLAGKALGEIKFHLNAIETQDEYEVGLDLMDVIDGNQIIAKLRCKVKFVWSLYKMYLDLLTKTEKIISKSNENIQKLNKIINILNEPFGFGKRGLPGSKTDSSNVTPQLLLKEGNTQSSPQKRNANQPQESDFHLNIKEKSSNQVYDIGVLKKLRSLYSFDKQIQISEAIEERVKSIFKIEEEVDWATRIVRISLALMLCSFLSSFAYSLCFFDFIVIGYVHFTMLTMANENMSAYLSQLFSLNFLLICYRVIWFLLCSKGIGTYDGGVENTIKWIAYITILLSFKGYLTLLFYIWMLSNRIDKRMLSDKHRINTASGANLLK